MLFVDVKTPFRWGMMSLIGTGRERPVSWGNYHTIRIPEKSFPDWFIPAGKEDEYVPTTYAEFRVVNMWRENLEHAMKAFISPDNEIKLRAYSSRFCVIDDDRIPEDYYYRPMHFNYAKFDQEEIKHAYDTYGDPTNEYEQFSNPRIYYARRGQVYRKGYISYGLNPDDPIRKEAAEILREYENNVTSNLDTNV